MKFSSRTIPIAFFIFLTSLILTAQDAVTPPPERTKQAVFKNPGPPSITLEIMSTVPIAGLYAAGLIEPVACGPNGDLYAKVFKLRPDAPPGFDLTTTIVGLNRKGKAYLSVGPERITDVQGVRMGSLFPTDDGLFLLIQDGDPAHAAAHQRDVFSLIHKSDSEHNFIARFDRDGTYRGSIRIDLPISALNLAVFPTGQFVVLGLDELNQRKILLLKPSGDFDRIIELPRKAAGKNSEVETQSDKSSLLVAGLFSQLVADGTHILLVSRTSDSVFAISSSGLVDEVHLNTGGSEISAVQAVPEGWLVRIASSEQSNQIATSRLFDRNDGHLIRTYVYEEPQHSVPGCIHENELTFLRRETDSSITLLTAVSVEKMKSNSQETPSAKPLP